MSALLNKRFKNFFQILFHRKDYFVTIFSLLIIEIISLLISFFISFFIKDHTILITISALLISPIKVKIAFSFNRKLNFSKSLYKLGYIGLFFLYFLSASYGSTNLFCKFAFQFDFSYIPYFLIIFMLNFLVIVTFKWFRINKPWAYILTDIFSLPIFFLDNPSQFLITPLTLLIVLFRCLFMVKLLSKHWSLIYNQKCMIIGELLSFYLFLTVILVTMKHFNFGIVPILATAYIYILVLLARMLLFTTYSFDKKDAKPLFIVGVIFITTISLLAFLLYVFANTDGKNMVTFLLPAIIPIIFQNFSTRKTFQKQVVFLKKFQMLQTFLNTLFFFTTISINILANLINMRKISFLPLDTLKNFSDYGELVCYSIMVGTFLTILSLVVFQNIFENPKNGFVKIIPNTRKFPKRLRK